jgi:hypothetical protein
MYTLVIGIDGTLKVELHKCPKSAIDFTMEKISTGKKTVVP